MKKIFANLGRNGDDATKFIEQIKTTEGPGQWALYMVRIIYYNIKKCMDGLLYTGVIDTRNSPQCVFSNSMLLVSTIILVAIIGVKFIAALQFSSNRDPEEHDKFVICCIPCYTEDAESLAKTFLSFALSRYDAKKKLMIIIADGLVTGQGNDLSTPELVLSVLGWEGEDPEPQLFYSLAEGSRQYNMAKVYSGLYNAEGSFVAYIVISKIGNGFETHKAGNRGKRDSQMILLQFLSRVHFKEPMSPLELELYYHIENVIGFRAECFEFLLWVYFKYLIDRLMQTLKFFQMQSIEWCHV